MSNRVVLIFLCLGLTACAIKAEWIKPDGGGTPAEFARTNYQCLQESQQMTSEKDARGARSGATTNQMLYNACMNAAGWYFHWF